MRINNETIGISAEVAIADHFNVFVDEFYRSRSNKQIVDLSPVVKEAFNLKRSDPIKLIARDQNPVDFLLADGTLSVKLTKVARKGCSSERWAQQVIHISLILITFMKILLFQLNMKELNCLKM